MLQCILWAYNAGNTTAAAGGACGTPPDLLAGFKGAAVWQGGEGEKGRGGRRGNGNGEEGQHRRRKSVSQLWGQDVFAWKYIINMCEKLIIKMPEFHVIFARKIFFPIFWGLGRKWPLSLISYTYEGQGGGRKGQGREVGTGLLIGWGRSWIGFPLVVLPTSQRRL